MMRGLPVCSLWWKVRHLVGPSKCGPFHLQWSLCPHSPTPSNLGCSLPACWEPRSSEAKQAPWTLDPGPSSSGRDRAPPRSQPLPILTPFLSSSWEIPPWQEGAASQGPRIMDLAGGWCGRRVSQACHHHGGSLLLSEASGKPGNQVMQLPRVCTCLREWRLWFRC